MSPQYLIVSNQSSSFCLAVMDAVAGAPVILAGVNAAPNYEWSMDPGTGYIRLVGNPDLCLDVQGDPSRGSQVIVNTLVPGRQAQIWNWASSPQIYNTAISNMVLDNSKGNAGPGNPILIWTSNGGLNQQWILSPVPSA